MTVTVTISQIIQSDVTLAPIVSPGVVIQQMAAGPAGPAGAGVETTSIVASEALSAGNLVNIWVDAGNLRVRKALATLGMEAHGYVLENVALGASATVRVRGENSAVAGLTVGMQYLSPTVAGACQATRPTLAGQLVQSVGFASSGSRLVFNEGLPILLAVDA